MDVAPFKGVKLVLPVESRLLMTDDRLDPPDDIDGVRGNDLEENRFNPVVKLFLKLFGGGLGASFRAPENSLSAPVPFDIHSISKKKKEISNSPLDNSGIDLSSRFDGDDARLIATQYSSESSLLLPMVTTDPYSRRCRS